MSTTLSDITTFVRYLLGDISKSQIPGDIVTYENSSIFTLSETNATAVSDVLVNDTSSGVSYSYVVASQKVTISSSLTAGDTVEIQYSYYPNYSDTEIKGYIHAAVAHLSVNRYYTFTIEEPVGNSTDNVYPDPTTSEKNLIAVIAALLIEPDNKTLRLPDITINTPRDLPLHDKIRKIVMVFKHNTHGVFDIL